MAARNTGRFQLFLWCPFEFEAVECGWSEGRERERERAIRCLGPHKALSLSRSLARSRYWQTALPRHPPTLFRTCYVEYSVARKIFFRLPRIDGPRIRHVARESRYLLCNLRKVEAIPPFPEFWWHMGGLGINRFEDQPMGDAKNGRVFWINPFFFFLQNHSLEEW